MQAMWVAVKDRLPPRGRPVVVLTAEYWMPFMGYLKDSGEGPFWVVPGMAGTVEWWADVIPTPWPENAHEQFRQCYEWMKQHHPQVVHDADRTRNGKS